MSKSKSMTLAEFARLGGLAAAKGMTKAQRQERAKKAAAARWKKKS
jgi:hypothetical protein